MAAPLCILRDHGEGGIVEHVVEHGVTSDEAEGVTGRQSDDRDPSHSTPEDRVVHGFTAGGRFLLVVFDYLAGEDTVIPATAFDAEVV